MAEVSRIKRTTNNMLFSFLSYFAKIALGMLSRIIFTHYFLSVYLGISGLFTNILTILSIAELGFGNAIIYSLYKPVAEDDKEKIRQLLQIYKRFYTIVAFVIFGIGLALLPFLKYLITDAPDVAVNINIVYLIFLSNAFLSYFFSYRKALLITNQRQDIESKITIVSIILVNIIQIACIIIFQNYYIYILLTVLFTVLENIVLMIITNKLYPEYVKKPLEKLSKEERKELSKNAYAMIFHKLESSLVSGTDNIIISAMISTTILGKYTAYATIVSYVATLCSYFVSAVRGSLGNYIATKKPEETERLFNKMNFGYMWFIGWCSVCLICLLQPFIKIWSIYSLDNFLLPLSIPLLLTLSFYFTKSRELVFMTKENAGLNWQDRYRCIFTVVINLAISVVLAHFVGIEGVIIGTIASTVLVSLWVEPKVIYKHYFKSKVSNYFLRYATYFIITIIVAGLTFGLCGLFTLTPWIDFMVKAAICVFVPNILYLLIYFKTNTFKETFALGMKIFKK